MPMRGMKITIAELDKKVAAGTLKGYKIVSKPKNKKAIDLPQEKVKKESKYKNKKVVWQGIEFDSIKELNRYKHLLYLQKAGEIKGLERQVVFTLNINDNKIANYICDHRYVLCKTGETIVEDVKSSATAAIAAFRLKKKMMKAILGIDILIV